VDSIVRIDVPVEDGSLAAFAFGAADSAAPLVLAAHGITANSRSWLPVARELGGRARLVALDLRGRGKSRSLGAPFGIGAHAADMVAVLDHLGAEQAVLAGHSMGAWIVARVGIDHPERVASAVLVDGGLALPAAEGVDTQAFLDAFLGPSIERLAMRFDSVPAYRAFWRQHPALAGPDVGDDDLAAFADHDLVGDAPELRSSVVEEAVRTDGAELVEVSDAIDGLAAPATLVRAPRGLRDGPDPLVPPESAAEWASSTPERREVVEVPGVNHYTITLGSGARAVADAIAARAGAR
jgi:pimeloyl-ACP methyl ester carboxylesterase